MVGGNTGLATSTLKTFGLLQPYFYFLLFHMPALAMVARSSSYIYRSNAFFGMCSNLFNYLYHPSFPLLGSNEDSYLLQPLYWLQHDVITAIESRPTKQKLNPAVTYGFCLICYLMLCILVCDTFRLVPMKEMLYEQYRTLL